MVIPAHLIEQHLVHVKFAHTLIICLVQANTQHTSDLNRIKNALFPNLPTFIGHLIATIILLFIIIRFLYIPFRQSQTRKHTYLTKVIADANEKLINAEIQKDKIFDEFEKAGKKCTALISEAREQAAIEKKNLLEQAYQKSIRIIESGDHAVKVERKKMTDQIQNQIVDNAFEIAEKIANENLKTKKNQDLIDDFVNSLNLNKKSKIN